jgi:dienelactone hydrolase
MSKRIPFLPILLALIPLAPRAEMIGRDMPYQVDGVEHRGYLAYNSDIKTKRPAILVIHEWWGHNDYARKRADQLAALGYVAFALDMYGEGRTADHPADAGKFAQAAMSDLAGTEKKLRVVLSLLRDQPQVDPSKIGGIGYCFGGGLLLQMARRGFPLDGIVSFHGSLATQAPAEKGAVKSRILVCHGGDDSFVPEEEVRALKLEMENADAELTVITYPKAKHSFTNPEADRFGKEFNLPLGYSAEADEKSWNDMQIFFLRLWK